MEKTRKINVTAYPYATCYGEIEIPANLTDKDSIKEYIEKNFNNIEFSAPDLDYEGTDFDFNFE